MNPHRALLPLTPLYAAGWLARDLRYGTRLGAPRRLGAPVISVGNLSVGGAGKTPLVIRLAQLLQARGYEVDVLSRGYGRQSSAVEQVHPHAPRSAARFGDEPTLIASASGVPVFVGRSRWEAGHLAERRPSLTRPRVHLLDDGFQHRQLHRTVDIVLLHRSDFHEHLLPAGRLREPFRALRRASFAVLRAEDADLEPLLRRRGLGLPVWRMLRTIVPPPPALEGPALAFCGIAHCSEFFHALARAGVNLAATHPFPDHHAYSARDTRTLAHSARKHGARTLLTTSKDLIRLTAPQLSALREAAPLHAVPLEVRLEHEADALHALLARITPGGAATV